MKGIAMTATTTARRSRNAHRLTTRAHHGSNGRTGRTHRIRTRRRTGLAAWAGEALRAPFHHRYRKPAKMAFIGTATAGALMGLLFFFPRLMGNGNHRLAQFFKKIVF